MAAPARGGSALKPTIDRQSTTPFHLKVFYRLNAFHHLSDFPIPPSPSRHAGGGADSHSAPLPAHLQIYTWQSCTLRELAQLLTTALPALLPSPAVGSRLCFRLIYPDTRSAAMMGPDVRGRYLSKDVGSVVVGASSSGRDRDRDWTHRHHQNNNNNNNNNDNDNDNDNNSYSTNNHVHAPIASEEVDVSQTTAALRFQGDEADKTLQEMRFVIGDYIDCAVLPPLEDGSVAPPIYSGRGPIGGGMRAFRENEFGAFGGGRFARGGRGGSNGMPSGDWRRGEMLPPGNGGGVAGARGGGGRGASGSGRRGWAPY